jgi:aspartyl-tRNA synthetase
MFCRSHGCGTLREEQVGEKVTICGWVDKRRDLGSLLFLDIRDHTGILQAVSSSQNAEVTAVGETVRQEWVVAITGTLQKRQDINENIPTGRVELVAEGISILNTVNRMLPFPVSASEEQEAPR